MLRLLGAVLTAVGCSWLGLKKAGELRAHTRALREMQAGLAQMAQELEWDAPPMADLMRRLADGSRGSAAHLFQNCSDMLAEGAERSFAHLWHSCVENQTELGQEGRACLEPLGAVLGQCGIPAQLRGLEQAERRLGALATQAEQIQREQGKVFCALGMSGGAFLVTLLL